MTAVEADVRRVVATHLDVDPEQLRPETRMVEDLLLDSLAAIELALVLEENLGVRLPDEVRERILTYGELVEEVTGQLDGRSPKSE